jgi:PKD repeat protein
MGSSIRPPYVTATKILFICSLRKPYTFESFFWSFRRGEMKRRIALVTSVLIALVAVSSVVSIQADAKVHPPNPNAEWLIMYYLEIDNELDFYWSSSYSPAFIAATNPQPSVKIAVLVDRSGIWSGSTNSNTRVYEANNHQLILKWDMGERNTGDSQTVVDFATWAISAYPAYKLMFVFMGHGRGDSTVGGDDSHGDALNLIEIKSALSAVKSQTKKSFGIVGFDACTMSTVGLAYQIKDYASVMVASEPETAGWEIEPLLRGIIANPIMDVKQFGAYIVTASYNGMNTEDNIGAIDLGKMTTLASPLETFSSGLCSRWPTYYDQFVYCRDSSYSFADGIDLYLFVQNVKTRTDAGLIPNDAGFYQSMTNIELTIDSMVIAKHYAYYPNAHGLAIFYPITTSTSTVERYAELDISLTGAPSWSRFMNLFFIGTQPPVAAFTATMTSYATVHVDASASYDPDGYIYSYEWSWGDGTYLNPSSTKITSHTYAAAGTYTIVLTVRDNAGGSGTKSQSVTVTIPTYILTVSGPVGQVSPSPGPHSYSAGTVVTLTAATASYTNGHWWLFDWWTIDGVDNDGSTTAAVTMNSDHTASAHYTRTNMQP